MIIALDTRSELFSPNKGVYFAMSQHGEIFPIGDQLHTEEEAVVNTGFQH